MLCQRKSDLIPEVLCTRMLTESTNAPAVNYGTGRWEFKFSISGPTFSEIFLAQQSPLPVICCPCLIPRCCAYGVRRSIPAWTRIDGSNLSWLYHRVRSNDVLTVMRGRVACMEDRIVVRSISGATFFGTNRSPRA